jgi:hypothetical protein
MSYSNQPINDKSYLLAQMVAFNEQYNAYLKCQGPPNTCSSELTDNLKKTLTRLMEFGGYSPTVSDQAYDAELKAITTTYNNNVLALRNELDDKMKELNDSDSSISKEYKTRYDLTIYAGIVWATLATSIVYYVFNIM